MNLIFAVFLYLVMNFVVGMSNAIHRDIKNGTTDGIHPSLAWVIWVTLQIAELAILGTIIKLAYPYLEAAFG